MENHDSKSENNSKFENDSYYNWEENTQFLYDYLFVEEIENPLISLQFQDFLEETHDSYNLKLIGGTNLKDEDNYLMVYDIKIPKLENFEPINKYNSITSKLKIPHEGEVNKLKINPLNKFMIATKTNYGSINLYNIFNKDDGILNRPMNIIQFGNDTGFALNWFENKNGFLTTGGEDKIFHVFDISQGINKIIEKKLDFAINDVLPDKINNNIVYIALENGNLLTYDIRENKISNKYELNNEIFSIDCNKNLDNQILVGGSSGFLSLIDFRSDLIPFYIFEGHKEDIMKVELDKNQKGIFSSISNDKKVIIWDILKIGDDIEDEEENSCVASELLFKHSGHTSSVSDFSWSNKVNNLCASCEEQNNILHIWKMSKQLID